MQAGALATPTSQVPVEIVRADGTVIRIGRAEHFEVSHRIWIRDLDLDLSGAESVRIADTTWLIKSIERRTQVLEVLLESR
ncbi:hypothetical protein [Burkholderia sp. Tr-20390]|uniref:hypothetical protein n=1 Tax=Burkholderia sp. Tr-20390 TaxID=2703904 RepID=UPI00197CFB0D|nr:hypothetical protein [Burkholderia sp. Tr-20390]MBN3729457.1 hypothetical protein [Burkholderia sp. Tr-20390]